MIYFYSKNATGKTGVLGAVIPCHCSLLMESLVPLFTLFDEMDFGTTGNDSMRTPEER